MMYGGDVGLKMSLLFKLHLTDVTGKLPLLPTLKLEVSIQGAPALVHTTTLRAAYLVFSART